MEACCPSMGYGGELQFPYLILFAAVPLVQERRNHNELDQGTKKRHKDWLTGSTANVCHRGTVGTIIGSWLGAIPIPLDW